jgi:hypothetical protein
MITSPKEFAWGVKTEREHKPTYEWLKKYIQSHGGKLPSETEFYAKIAEDHLREFSNYYTALMAMEEELQKAKRTRR